MYSRRVLTFRTLLTILLTLSLLPTAVSADPQAGIADIEFLGSVVFETGFTFEDTEVGGLSGITYDIRRQVYYVLSDDRSDSSPARFYSVGIDLADSKLDDGDVRFEGVTTLLGRDRRPFPRRGIDPEGIVLTRSGRLYIASEGDSDADPPLNPFVKRFYRTGRETQSISIPDKFLPSKESERGVRNNLAFESLTATPDGKFLYTATENALLQDGPASTLISTSLSRILRIGVNSATSLEEYVYVVGSIPVAPDPPGSFADNGLVELIALDDNGTLLALERSFAVGIGNTIRLYQISTQNATDVSGMDDLYDELTGVPREFEPVEKQLLVDLADLGIDPDNVEGMTLGPVLLDGRQTLILVSDNNFNPAQETQFIALAMEYAQICAD